MKKTYQPPCVKMAEMESARMLDGSNEVKDADGNAGIGYGGGGSGDARARQHSVWDDDGEE